VYSTMDTIHGRTESGTVGCYHITMIQGVSINHWTSNGQSQACLPELPHIVIYTECISTMIRFCGAKLTNNSKSDSAQRASKGSQASQNDAKEK
jgi:hypothetical protein